MATKRWVGGAVKVAQVRSFTIDGTWETDDIIRVVIGQKVKDFAAGSTTPATIVSTFVTAWNALDEDIYPEFAEITASTNSATIVLTADEEGIPFSVSMTPLEANGSAADAQTINASGSAGTGTATTANSGPQDIGVARNWSDNALPANGDTVIFDANEDEIIYGLESLAAITTLTIHITKSFTGKIGAPIVNELGNYPEYRTRYWTLAGITLLEIGRDGDGTGSSRIMIDAGSSAITAANIYASGTSDSNVGEAAIQIKGTNSGNVIRVFDGQVDVAYIGGEAANISGGLTIGREGGSGQPQVRLGRGVTIGAMTQYSGMLEVNSAIVTSLTIENGRALIQGTGAVAQLTGRRNAFIDYRTTGALNGNTVLSEGAILSFDGDQRTKTVTFPIDCYSGATVQDTDKAVTPVAQIQTYAFAGTWEADDVIRATFTGQGTVTYDFTAGSTTATTVIDNMVTTWNNLAAATYPEFRKLTASRSSSNLVLTANSAGTPFTCMLTPLESDLSPSGAQTIEAVAVATLGTTATANVTGLIVDYNSFDPGFGMGTNVRVSRAGVA